MPRLDKKYGQSKEIFIWLGKAMCGHSYQIRDRKKNEFLVQEAIKSKMNEMSISSQLLARTFHCPGVAKVKDGLSH